MATQYLSSTRFIKGKLFTVFEEVFHIEKNTVDCNHVGYKFIKHTDAINYRKACSIGIYSDAKGRKYIIKDYAYTLKNLEYEYLHNEINTLRVLSNQSLTHTNIRVARLVDTQDSNKRITLITEYVKGTPLTHYSKDVIQQVLIDTITYLHKLYHKIPPSQLETIPKRLQILTYIMFPLNLLRVLIKEPSQSSLFLKGALLFLRHAPLHMSSRISYGICHRDLSPDNILYDSSTKYSTILDTESMIRADELYDVALLPRLYIRLLNADQFLSIFQALCLKRSDMHRLIVLMINACIIKIATERKDALHYTYAIEALILINNTLIPRIIQKL